MSNKSVFNPFRKKTKPRPMAEIGQEYAKLKGAVADAQYQAFVYEKEQKRLNLEMEKLNVEANDRQKLDAEAKAKQDASPAAAVKPEAK